jgi:hypothetical protein
MSGSILTGALTNVNRRRVLGFAAVNRIPAMDESSVLPRDGGLVSYGSATAFPYSRKQKFARLPANSECHRQESVGLSRV